jgi:enterochelin esterase-like enzyme
MIVRENGGGPMRVLLFLPVLCAAALAEGEYEQRHAEAMALVSEGQFRSAILELQLLAESFPEKKAALEADVKEVQVLAEAALDEAVEKAEAAPEQAEMLLGGLARRAPDDIARRAQAALKDIKGDDGPQDEPPTPPPSPTWRYDGLVAPEDLQKVSATTRTSVEEAVEEFLVAGNPDARNAAFQRIRGKEDATPDFVAAVILRGGRFEAIAAGDYVWEYALPAGEKRTVLVSVPQGYAPDRLWPVFVHLHGTHGTLDLCRAWAPYFRDVAGGRYVVAQPVAPENSGWGPMKIGEQQATSVVKFMRSKFPIDPDRVWLAGQSMGAHGTWHQAMRYADRYAAFLPKSGSPYGAYGANWKEYCDNLKFAPSYFIHGARDPMFPIKTPREFAAICKERKLNVDYREFAQSGHEGAPDDEIRKSFEWMTGQVRDAYPRAFAWTADYVEFARYSWLESTRLSSRVPTANVNFVDQKKNPVESRTILTVPAKMTVEVQGQVVTITTKNVEKLRIHWTPKVLDLTKEVSIKVNGSIRWKGTPTVSIRQMLDEARRTGRRDVVYYGFQDVDVP